jgi:hypothetical protein
MNAMEIERGATEQDAYEGAVMGRSPATSSSHSLGSYICPCQGRIKTFPNEIRRGGAIVQISALT